MTLNTKQQSLIIALLESSTTEEAIRKTGISRKTAYNYLADTEFKQELSNARRETINGITNQLRNLGGEAIEVLRHNLHDDEATPASKNTTAKTILDFVYKSYEIESVEERLDQLETKLQQYNNNN